MSMSPRSSLPPPQGSNSSHGRSDAHRPTPAKGIGHPTHKRHPARGARAVALAASVVATGGVAVGMAYGEGAFSNDSEPFEEAAVAPSASTATAAADIVDPARVPEHSTTANTTEIVSDRPPAADEGPQSTDVATDQPAGAEAITDNSSPIEASAGSSVDGVFLGPALWIQWGFVQVEVTISDGQIVDTEAVRKPRDRRSKEINDQALPILEAQAIANQSSDLDIVSGATYTSRSYARSLQAALDEAALADSTSNPASA